VRRNEKTRPKGAFDRFLSKHERENSKQEQKEYKEKLKKSPPPEDDEMFSFDKKLAAVDFKDSDDDLLNKLMDE